jgi:tetratricopeptide (TPR) repeat protein/transcriptional regulator with XRE-family HTH domain
MDYEPVPGFGDLLRRYRVMAGMTQEELAERAGVSPRSIGDIERGISRAPHQETAALLADALGLTGDARAEFKASARRRATRITLPSPEHPFPAAGATTRPTQSAPLLVGRSRELSLVEQHLEEDGPPILILAGEPGLGKTRLLAEAGRRATLQGWCVLDGGCQRRGSQHPFAPLLDAMSGFLGRRSAAELRGDLVGCAWLVRLLPELADAIGEALPTLTLPPEQERRLMFAAVGRLLANLGRRDVRAAGRILFVLDDLQWVGSDALDLLTALVRSDVSIARSGEQFRLRVVGAYRDTEVRAGDALAVALADWAQAGLATHRALPRLSSDDCGRLLDKLLADAEPRELGAPRRTVARERVLQRAGGVPFFVVSYAQALRRGEIRDDADGVPWDAGQGIRQRVAALPESARALVAMAAVIGRVSQPSLLVSVMGRPEEEVLAGLEAACQGRLLIDREQAYHFAHDLVREVVEADLGSARLVALHRRVAAAIEQLHADYLAEHYEILAEHYLRGEAWEQALRYLALSGDKAVGASAIREARIYYEQALGLCARLGPPFQATAAAVAEKRAFVCYDSGDFVGAVADFARMRDAAARVRDRRREGLALAYGGMAAFYGHDFEAAERTLRDALVVADEGFDDVRLFASNQLGSLLMTTGRHAEAQPFLRANEELASRVDDPVGRAWWAYTGSEVLHWSGRYDDALALLDKWQGAVTASNQLLLHQWTKWEAVIACGGKGEYARALTLVDEVETTCASVGETFIRARALNTAGWIRGELQDHEQAIELNQKCLGLVGAIETADIEIESNARLNLGDSLLALGRMEEAEAQFQVVERIVRNPRPTDHWMLWRYAQHLFHSYGELWLARGNLAKALAYADDCLERAEASDSKKNMVKACRLRGEVFLGRGELSSAEVEFDRALEIARRIGNPPQLWKTLVAIGSLRQAQNHRNSAKLAYNEALATVEQVAAHLPDTGLRETFLTSSHVQHIWQRASAASSTNGWPHE